MQAEYRVISNQEDARDIIDLKEHFWMLQTAAETMDCSVQDAATVSRSLSAKQSADISKEIAAMLAELLKNVSSINNEAIATCWEIGEINRKTAERS